MITKEVIQKEVLKIRRKNMRFNYFYQLFVSSKFWRMIRFSSPGKIEIMKPEFLEDAEVVCSNFYCKSDEGPTVGLVKDGADYADYKNYWPKYERYLKKNKIAYEYLDIKKSNWMEKANEYDIIVWRSASDAATRNSAESKIYILEKIYRKKCLPSYRELWFYENKIRQYYLLKALKFPVVETFISNSKEESLNFISKTRYPLVSKIKTGASAFGVELVKDSADAKKIIEKSFGRGRITYMIYERQKDYVYFQKFIEHALYDLRVIAIGDKYLGYYRLISENDFRASGSGIYEKKEIPSEALILAKQVKQRLGINSMIAVDMITTDSKVFQIIEISTFCGVFSSQQLHVNGVPGYYLNENDGFRFIPGKFWIQELALNEVVNQWYKEKNDGGIFSKK